MKQYFIFKNNADIVMVDIAKIIEREDVLIIRGSNIEKILSICFGCFFKPIKLEKLRGTEENVNTYTKLSDGGFSYHDNYKRKGEKSPRVFTIKSIDIRTRPSMVSYIMEFEDDESAELWVEAMKSEYNDIEGWW